VIIDFPQSITAGSRLGHYVICGALGAGGMGEVYEAQDTRLHRQVALKVVRRDVASDAVRRRRLEREASAAAVLNHPHIVTLHSLEEHESVLFLTMELIDGSTLADTIPPQGLPPDRLFPLAIQLADALAAAHACGVVHGDLKPANIMVTREGAIKVLDFGLSKIAVDESPGLLNTDALLVENGLLGTAPYMSPERIEGTARDARSDIFALGVVLFEMATGRRPFNGRTPLATLTSILGDVPPLASDENTGVSEDLARLVDRCLVKEPARRRQSAADLRADLEDLARARVEQSPAPLLARRMRPRAWAVLAGIGPLACAGMFWLWPGGWSARPADRVARFTVDLPKGEEFWPGFNPDVALSPDGTQLAFTPNFGSLSIRRVNGLETHPIEAAKAPDFRGAPMFSPDGTFVSFIEGNAFFSSRRPFQKAALSGGAATTLTEYDMFNRGEWAPDGWIYWTAHYPGGIARISESGGAIQAVTELDSGGNERSHRFAHVLPDGQALIYTVAFNGIETYDDARIDLWDLRTRQKKTLITGGTSAAYSPSGHIVYARAGKLLAVPFDVARREVTGSPFEVLDGVSMSGNTGAANFALSRRGDLAYVPGSSDSGHRTLQWVDRSGRAQPLPLPPASYLYPRLSPDGRNLAVEIEGPNHDLYVYDFARSVLTKMTTDGLSHDPVWTPDGKRLAFRSWQSGGMTMWWMPADRSAAAVRLNPAGTRQSPVSFSPDGKFLTFDEKDPQTNDDAWVLALEGTHPATPVARSRFGEGSAKFSPDGRWIAYSSNESGKSEVYVQAFPGPGPKLQISSGGGFDAVWRGDGRELYYRSARRMMAVSIANSADFRPSAPHILWEATYASGFASSCGMPGVSSSNYAVTSDGQRFLMVRNEEGTAAATKIVVVINWADEVAALSRARTDHGR
jgi:tRNA A-37 threonylcarbamoyl transferase component Bud32